jgi:hypothetical protein
LTVVSTLNDANFNRDSEVFESIYLELPDYDKDELNPDESSFLAGQVDTGKVFFVDSSTISLFVDVFKGAGRNPMTGTKKGGLKIHAKLPLGGFVPSLIHITEAACNDKYFLGQLGGNQNTGVDSSDSKFVVFGDSPAVQAGRAVCDDCKPGSGKHVLIHIADKARQIGQIITCGQGSENSTI